jgi:hypothetical protein
MKLLRLLAIVALTLQASYALAQKVKVGFDKSADFSRYHTYSWPKDAVAPGMAPRRLAVIVEIDYQLKAKGLTRVEENGDLLLNGFGSFEGGLGGGNSGFIFPSYSTIYSPVMTMWAGSFASPSSLVIDGGLALQFIDNSAQKLVWQGAVSQKLDSGKRGENLKQIQKAITKLLEKFPPKKET